MKTAPMMEIIDILLKNLTESEKINKWCTGTMGKEPRFFIGINANNPPKEDDCPYIILIPDEKAEGIREKLRYSVAIAWCVYNDAVIKKDAVFEYAGTRQTDGLGQLILEELSKELTNSEVKIDYTIDAMTQFPQFPGEMRLQIEIPYTMSRNKVTF